MRHASESTVGSAKCLASTSSTNRRPLPTLTILAHPEVGRVGDRAVLGELVTGVEVSIDRLHPEFHTPGVVSGRPLDDRHLSRRPLQLAAADSGGWQLRVDGTPTAVRVDGRAVQSQYRFSDADLASGLVIELARRIALLLHLHTPADKHEPKRFGLVGHSEGMTSVRDEIRRVAGLDVGVLIHGETGTGKELVARALHDLGPRPDGPFVAVNLGALPPSLAASTLFGATRGAYTGSTGSQEGCFVRADGGTLFLDEVGEAPAEIQVALLRVLETGEVQPLGSCSPRKVAVRTLAATDADLGARITAGTFREPLLHRLAAYELWLPPLRQRRDDIGRLLVHFLRQQEAWLEDDRLGQSAEEPWIDTALMSRLARFDWPGNVRQLLNVVRQLAIGNRGRRCLLPTAAVDRLLQPQQADGKPAVANGRPVSRRLPSEIDDVEILAALRDHHFEIKRAAAALKISRAALYAWIEGSPLVSTVGQLDAETIRQAHDELDGELEAVATRLEVSPFALRRRLRELGL